MAPLTTGAIKAILQEISQQSVGRGRYARGGGGGAGITATGGVISDYTTPPGAVYRAHIFTSSGTFSVSSIGGYGSNVEYLVVAGGGGGGGGGGSNTSQGGGGGAGGYRTSVPGQTSGGGAPTS